MQQRILVTGFEPFGGMAVNSAWEAARALDGRCIAGYEVVGRPLSVIRKACIEEVVRLIQELDPVLIVVLGQAWERATITPERVALNVDDYRMPDNAGNQPCDEPAVENGPVAYWSTLPLRAMVAALQKEGVPSGISDSAGTFVCNHLFYGLMHFLAAEGNVRRGGFIHVPRLPDPAVGTGAPAGLTLEAIVRGLEAAIAAAVPVS